MAWAQSINANPVRSTVEVGIFIATRSTCVDGRVAGSRYNQMQESRSPREMKEGLILGEEMRTTIWNGTNLYALSHLSQPLCS